MVKLKEGPKAFFVFILLSSTGSLLFLPAGEGTELLEPL
jgi:hypothetical protein